MQEEDAKLSRDLLLAEVQAVPGEAFGTGSSEEISGRCAERVAATQDREEQSEDGVLAVCSEELMLEDGGDVRGSDLDRSKSAAAVANREEQGVVDEARASAAILEDKSSEQYNKGRVLLSAGGYGGV